MAFRISFRDLFDASRGNWNDRFPNRKKYALRGEVKNSRVRIQERRNAELGARLVVLLGFLNSELTDSLYPGRMIPDQDQRLLRQRLSWLDPMPRRGPGRVRQRDHVKRFPIFFHSYTLSNQFRQSR